MSHDPAADLPPAERLALAYAPAPARPAIVALMALDRRLARIVRQPGEPLLARIKLAWWRERLAEPRSAWPAGEPLLMLLREWPGEPQRLAEVVDGWEEILADPFAAEAIAAHAAGRAAGWAALAGERERQRVGAAAQEWALVDLALHLAPGDEREVVLALARQRDWARVRFAAPLRPLGVLHALARRALREDRPALLDGAGAILTALRGGLIAG